MSNVVKEFECRIMLTENEYFEIVSFYLKQYPNHHFLQNVNVYFDNDDLFLRNKHITLRARTINDLNCELTLKVKGDNGDTEINDPLTIKEADLLLNNNVFPEGNVKNYLLSLERPLSDYHQITTLYNRRLEIAYPDHLLVIDKNTYGDVVDYNIEVESKIGIEHAKEMLKHYAQQFNLTLSKEKYLGKARRAINQALKNN